MARIVKRPEQRRQEIVAGARALFQAKGYQQTSMQDVITRLGIAKGTVYHYFRSKEELLVAVVELIVSEDIAHKRRLVASISGSALDKMHQLILSNSLDTNNTELLNHLHSAGNAGMHTRVLGLAVYEQAQLYGELIAQGCAEGIFNTQHPRECAEFILAAIQFLTDTGVYPWAPEDLMRRIQAFPTLVEQVTGAQPGAFGFLNKIFG